MLCSECGVVADLIHPVLVPCSCSVIFYLAGALVDEGCPRVILVRIVIFGVLQSADGLAEIGGSVCAGTFEIHSRTVFGAVPERLVGQFDKVSHSDKIVAFERSGCNACAALVTDDGAFSAAFLGSDDNYSVCAPYSAPADASFRTVRDSMSAGLMALKEPS